MTRYQNHTKRSGFTIVELLIVIVVIAILAAITIVAFNGVQDRARSSAASSSSTQAAKKIKVWQVDNELQSPDCPKFYELVTGTTTGAPAVPTPPVVCTFTYKDASYQYTPSSTVAGGYCVTTTVVTKSYKVSESQTPINGGCNGHAQGGVATITNWAVDPDAATSTSNFSTSGSAVAPATSTIASDRAHRGSTSLKRAITASAANGTGAKVSTPGLSIAASESMAISFWIYSTRAGTITPIVEGARVSDAVYSNCVATAVSVPANSWTQILGSCAPTSAMNVSGVGAYNLSTVQAGDTVWFDEFMITKGATQYNYADGGSTNWTWNGTQNNATSTGLPL